MTLNIEKIIAESVNAFNSSDKKYFVRFMNLHFLIFPASNSHGIEAF